jgi:hypothetical protein
VDETKAEKMTQMYLTHQPMGSTLIGTGGCA